MLKMKDKQVEPNLVNRRAKKFFKRCPVFIIVLLNYKIFQQVQTAFNIVYYLSNLNVWIH